MSDKKVWKLGYGFTGLYYYAYRVGCMCDNYRGPHFHSDGTRVSPTHVEDANENVYPFDPNKNTPIEYLELRLGENTNDIRRLIGSL